MGVMDFWVSGIARTKGSVDTGAHGQVLHTQASKDRAEVIRKAAKAAMELAGWQCVRAPTAVEIMHIVWLPQAAGRDEEAATRTNIGDLDKIERNLWDSLENAGVFENDVQVVDVVARKHIAIEPQKVGEYVVVRTVPAAQCRMRRQRDETLVASVRDRVVGIGAVPRGF
jgi:Holliday junction resolvase RusA-like endonuclease